MNLRGANRLMGIAAGRFDGHAHVFRADLPMAGNRRYTPGYDAELGDYCGLLRANGLDGALLVQPSFLGTDNGFLLAALERAQAMDDLQFRGVAMLAPETGTDAIAALSAAGIVGLRLNLVGGAARGFDFAAWDGLLRRIDRAGWHVELHAEGPLLSPLLTGLLARCETVVIDHFGLPDPERPLECDGFGALLASPPGRTLVKISAPYRVFPALGPAEAAAACTPLLARLAGALGPDQLVWGSDWPWTRFEDRQSYAETLDWFA